ncbi:AbrB family transcriptional regulator [Candidatus Woesearchaeota archaeon]|nr:AbrB family transcriptional regulator [Candidatus Woesearchaeota archaeon]
MSSKGQIVIPRNIREDMDADEGTVFAVVGSKDSVVLKKIVTPSKEELIRELRVLAREGAKRAAKKGIKESDVPGLIHKSRRAK